ARPDARSTACRDAGSGAARLPRRRRSARRAAPLREARRRTGAPAAACRPAHPPGLAVTAVRLFGVDFQNPVLLASGTAGFGREVEGVIDLDTLGGIVTKAVTLEPRRGHAAPRVAEFAGGMLNAVGLANPGLATVREHELPWLAARLTRARVLVNVAGATVADYVDVIAGLTGQAVIAAFEINASCPNTTAGGLEFGATPEGLRELVRRCRAAATKPISVKLSPVLPGIVAMGGIAACHRHRSPGRPACARARGAGARRWLSSWLPSTRRAAAKHSPSPNGFPPSSGRSSGRCSTSVRARRWCRSSGRAACRSS